MIIGAGPAGAKAADTLREEGFDGRVLLIGAEPEPPYERPPLSKEYLRGEAGREKVWVNEDESHYENAQIELRTQTEASAVHASTREVELAGGERIAGAGLEDIHYLRSVGFLILGTAHLRVRRERRIVKLVIAIVRREKVNDLGR